METVQKTGGEKLPEGSNPSTGAIYSPEILDSSRGFRGLFVLQTLKTETNEKWTNGQIYCIIKTT